MFLVAVTIHRIIIREYVLVDSFIYKQFLLVL